MDHLALLEGEVTAMAAALHATDPAQDIPWCPGWAVADLTTHLTAVHRWVLGALNNDGPPPYAEAPATPEEYAEAAATLLTRLKGLPSDAPCWTFNKADGTAGFWRRRQLQEVSIHRWDADQHSLDPEIAADGVSEVVDFFLPRQLSAGRATLPAGTVVLDDGNRSWTLTSGEGPSSTIKASTEDLNLLLWKRRSLDDVQVDGDRSFAGALFSVALTP